MLLRQAKRSHEEAFASKREAFSQGKTTTSCLLHSSEKNGKKGLTVCDFSDEARSTQQKHPLLRKYQDTIQLVVSGHQHKWVDYHREYGPQHYIMAATRYDPNAYMLMEVDTKRATWRFMNESLVEWSTHYSKAYVAG